MIRLILFFLVLLPSVYLGTQLKHDPGYVLISINHWTIESTLFIAIVCIVLAFLITHIALLMISWMIHFPNQWKAWNTKRRIRLARAKTRRGLIEFSEGHWLQAKNNLIKALPDTDTPLLNYLTAARAAQEMGDNKLRDDYLRQAQKSMPEAKIAVELTQAQLQLANQQWEQALATLRHLQDLVPQHTYVLKLLMNLYEEVKDWPQLIALLPAIKRNRVISPEDYHQVEKKAYLQAMLDLIRLDQDIALKTFINKQPKRFIDDPLFVAVYSQYLLSKQQNEQAETLLRQTLRKQFDEQLIELYGCINLNIEQLKFAESLLKTHPRSAHLLLCLGKLSVNQQLWGKARMYFEQSITYKAQPAAYMALGKLLEQLGDITGACAAYSQGLLELEI
jgi:HemY protein